MLLFEDLIQLRLIDLIFLAESALMAFLTAVVASRLLDVFGRLHELHLTLRTQVLHNGHVPLTRIQVRWRPVLRVWEIC